MDNEALIHLLLVFAVVGIIAGGLGAACACAFIVYQFRDLFRRG